MNNIIPVLGLVFLLSDRSTSEPSTVSKASIPTYFDTFKLELLIDKLHELTDTLDKINHLNQMSQLPLSKSNSLDRIQDYVDTVGDLMKNSPHSQKLHKVSGAISGVRQFGDIQSMISTIGPLMSQFSALSQLGIGSEDTTDSDNELTLENYSLSSPDKLD